MAQLTNKKKWPALLRGSVLSRVIYKNINYVGLADKRAQTIITINAFLIPLSLTFITNPIFKSAVIILASGCILSLVFAILSLMPKKYSKENHNHEYVFHFSQFDDMHEEEYMQRMKKVLDSPEELSKLASLEIFHMGKYVLRPKFFWLKQAYWVFLAGLMLSTLTVIIGFI